SPRCAICMCFFFPAEDGIRDRNVTGVQTCALPISHQGGVFTNDAAEDDGEEDTDQPAEEIDTGENPTLVSPVVAGASGAGGDDQIGRASCRERVERRVGAG